MKRLIIFLLACFFLSCGTQNSNRTNARASDSATLLANKHQSNKIDSMQEKGMIERVKNLKNSVALYMEDAKPLYNAKHIDQLETILIDYLQQIANSKSQEEGMKIIQETVMKLNKLNNDCKGTLIETGEREQIAEIIILAGYNRGYNSINEDITERWREW